MGRARSLVRESLRELKRRAGDRARPAVASPRPGSFGSRDAFGSTRTYGDS